jgi:hypothetical protein
LITLFPSPFCIIFSKPKHQQTTQDTKHSKLFSLLCHIKTLSQTKNKKHHLKSINKRGLSLLSINFKSRLVPHQQKIHKVNGRAATLFQGGKEEKGPCV